MSVSEQDDPVWMKAKLVELEDLRSLLAEADREVALLRAALEEIADTADVYGPSMVATARAALGRPRDWRHG